jgi:lipopolysaccharide export LptBFGC system permease protein LptF
MKIIKYFLIAFLLFNIENVIAQNHESLSQSTIHIESIKGNDVKMGEGYFFVFQLTKDKTYYSSILVSKKLINNASKINLFFKKEVDGKSSNEDTYILTIPNNSDYIIQDIDKSNDLIAIPFRNLEVELEKAGIKTSQVFLVKESLSTYKIPIVVDDLEKIQKIWESKF